MSLQTSLTSAFTRVGTEFKTLRATLGSNTNLTTSVKDTLVNAINEVNAKTASAGAQIDDTTARTTTVYSSSKSTSVATAAGTAAAQALINDTTASATSVYSSTKTNSAITTAVNTAVSGLLNGAPAAYDTLKEIADYIASDTTGAANMTASINNKVDYTVAQTLTTTQQNQALSNINGVSTTLVGDTTRDFSGDFTAALV